MSSWLAIVVRSFVSRLVLAQLEHLDLGGDLVARPHRRAEAPIDVQEDAPRPREVLGDHRVEQAGGDAALDDQAAEARARRGLLVVVQRVAVAGQRGEQLDVARLHEPAAAGGVADFHAPRVSAVVRDGRVV